MASTQLFKIAKGDSDCNLIPRMANRHGLIAGATGTGKTVTLQVIAENFSRAGVPVFMADVKGDLSGLSKPGKTNEKIEERLKKLKITDHAFEGYPVMFWDLYGKSGHPIRTTVTDMGPMLLSRILNLNDTQTGTLNIIFKIADDNGLPILDIKDLRAMLQFVADNASEFTTEYGRVSTASVGAIQRSILELQNQGAELFFGEPALNIEDFIQTDEKGKGYINILAADQLINSPKLYATFLLWLLAELFELLPEVGDMDKPKIVFFFDEAHLLFADAPKALLEKIEQVVRLIRSKGVGVYFITQNPLDIPQTVLGQLGNRVQHALRAFTPQDQKAVKAAAQTFRANPKLDVEKVITELAVGEALLSFLEEDGKPGIVQRAFILPPRGQIGPITPQERNDIIANSPIKGAYDKTVDRESAYEMLKARAGKAAKEKEEGKLIQKETKTQGRKGDTLMEALLKSAARTVGSTVGRQIVRGIMGSLLGGKR
ncbi:MAG: helicase HerA-like C-terminal domain-containing protein [Spirochaetota bacterium]